MSNLKTDDFFKLNFSYDENYIVTYSRGCMVNNIPIQVESAYNIKSRRIVELDSNIKEKLEYMLLCSKGFSLEDLVSIINSWDMLYHGYDKRVKEVIKYLSGGNENISREQVIDYIYANYPKLKKYYNSKPSPMPLFEYRLIVIDKNIYWFHMMPQIVDENLEKQKELKK